MITELQTTCCITGGGPAGMMAGFLLARAGVDVIVLEKHPDFNRDFRGDTIHPSTFELMYELGLLDEFLKVRHQEIGHLKGVFNGAEIEIADFTTLQVAKPVAGIMPQWDFLNFIAAHAKLYPHFHLMMDTEATDLLTENGKITGVKANSKQGQLHILADLVIATDGRTSRMRSLAKLDVIDTGVPIDVLWFRLSKQPGVPPQTIGRFNHGAIMIMLERGDYWQCGYVIEKGGIERIKSEGLDAFRQKLVDITPFLSKKVNELKSWDDIKLLSVKVDHLEQWYTDGFICIGDAAHAMSPVGGVGINLAIQDAVATANILYKYLRKHQSITTEVLEQIQQRREMPARMIQRIQVQIHKGITEARQHQSHTPLPFRLLRLLPFLRRIPAHLVGMGIRPEHIETPDIMSPVHNNVT